MRAERQTNRHTRHTKLRTACHCTFSVSSRQEDAACVSDLNGGVKERDVVEQRFPLRHVTDVELVLCYDAVRTLEAGFHAVRRFRGELDRRLHASTPHQPALHIKHTGAKLENLSRPTDIHTHAGNAFDSHVTFTFHSLTSGSMHAERLPCPASLTLITRAVFLLERGHSRTHCACTGSPCV